MNIFLLLASVSFLEEHGIFSGVKNVSGLLNFLEENILMLLAFSGVTNVLLLLC
jgi:hypothetical protein